MDIYNFKDINHISKCMEPETFSEMLVSVADNPKFKSIGKLSQYAIVFLHQGSVEVKETPYQFLGILGTQYHDKKREKQFFLIKRNEIFKLKVADKSYYGTASAGELFLHHDKHQVEDFISTHITSVVSRLSAVEKKAWQWLESGDVSGPAMTLCYHAFPQLSPHHRLKELIVHGHFSAPMDQSDFQRVLDLCKAVPEVRQHLSIMQSVSDQWRVLLRYWDNIEAAILKKDTAGAQLIIKNIMTGPVAV